MIIILTFFTWNVRISSTILNIRYFYTRCQISGSHVAILTFIALKIIIGFIFLTSFYFKRNWFTFIRIEIMAIFTEIAKNLVLIDQTLVDLNVRCNGRTSTVLNIKSFLAFSTIAINIVGQTIFILKFNAFSIFKQIIFGNITEKTEFRNFVAL